MACDSGTGTLAIPDMAMKPSPMPDLAIKMTGCRGYLLCSSKAMTQADQDACDAAATQMAMDLLNAVNDCLTTACLNTLGDGGTPFCSSGSDTSMRCSNCIQNAIKTGGACADKFAACQADKP